VADIIFPDEAPVGVIGETKLPENVDLAFWKGDSQEFIIRFKDDQGNPLQLAGFTPSAIIRASFNSPTTYTFTTNVQNNNEVRVYLPSSISKTIPAGDYIWNLQLTAPNGDVRTYLAGDVTVHDEVD